MLHLKKEEECFQIFFNSFFEDFDFDALFYIITEVSEWVIVL